ncbi:MAG TPA: hypothetical protein VE173_11360 [Longimicrobiales bacterium]|nr:hypothetical protein [Longimicrobiales bacterium]
MEVSVLANLPPWEWPPEAGESILGALRAGKADERRLAAELAGNVVVINDELVETLLSIVESPDDPPDLRAMAAISLGPTLEELDLGWLDDPEDESVTPSVARAIQDHLRAAYMDPAVPKDVRRRVLEASVRCPEDWHTGAVRAAYHSGDPAWRLSAVFCMGFVGEFDGEIVEALQSDNAELRFEAVRAAGRAVVEPAWPLVSALVRSPGIDRPLLLAAIDAVASIQPETAPEVLGDLILVEDEEIAEAVQDALIMAGAWNRYDDEREDPDF